MSNAPNEKRPDERFTMLEPREPNNLSEQQKLFRVAEVTSLERFTMLPARPQTRLTDEQERLISRLLETIADGGAPVESLVSALVERSKVVGPSG